ncbi:MAG: hypothetical protein LBJ08_01440 [Bifidobacteriaceae bacterium]|jgi:hypothetical protein|nr:hypothetical protein [Bifidobacteriaceae bacterium]
MRLANPWDTGVRLVAVAAVAIAAAGTLAGCTEGEGKLDVPSREDVAAQNPEAKIADDDGGTGGTASSTVSQKQAAETFYACLTDEDLPATIADEEGGQARVNLGGEGIWGWKVQATGQWQIFGDSPPQFDLKDVEAEAARLTRLAEASPRGYVVFIDGADRTEPYATCLDTSGYTEPVLAEAEAAGLAHKQFVAEASNDWAACARLHGYPDLRDTTAEKDSDPVVLLPATITAAQVEQLAADCPPFDLDAGAVIARRAADAGDEHAEGGWLGLPVIGFDVPGWREQENEPEPPPGTQPVDHAHYGELYNILWAARNTYAEERNTTGPAGSPEE